jgi:hypothetical protein
MSHILESLPWLLIDFSKNVNLHVESESEWNILRLDTYF